MSHAIGIYNGNWKQLWKDEREQINWRRLMRKQEFDCLLEAVQLLDPNWETWWDETPASSNWAMMPLMREHIKKLVAE